MTAEELVKKQYPDAIVDDTGHWIFIRNQQTVTERCPHCKQEWEHKVLDYSVTLGYGSTESVAWENSAKNLPG